MDLLIPLFSAPQLAGPVSLTVEHDTAYFTRVLATMAYPFVADEVSGVIPYCIVPQTWLERKFKISNDHSRSTASEAGGPTEGEDDKEGEVPGEGKGEYKLADKTPKQAEDKQGQALKKP